MPSTFQALYMKQGFGRFGGSDFCSLKDFVVEKKARGIRA